MMIDSHGCPFCIYLSIIHNFPIIYMTWMITVSLRKVVTSYILKSTWCDDKTTSWTHLSRTDSRFTPSQWETALLCNDVTHWLGTSLVYMGADQIFIHAICNDTFSRQQISVLSHEIGTLNSRIALKFDRHIGSTAAEVPVKFQSDRTILNTNLAASRLNEILRKDVFSDIETGPRCLKSLATNRFVQQL